MREQLADLVRIGTAQRLAHAGVLDPRRMLAGAAALPWVLGRGPSLGVLAQIHALSRPTRPAIVDRHGTLTWWELNQRVNRCARALTSRGARPGDQVAMVLRNGREFCEVVLAAQTVGLVPAPLNTWGRGRELGGILDRERPAVLVYDVRHADVLEDVVPDGTALVHVGEDDESLTGSTSYEDLLAAERALPPSPIGGGNWGEARVVIHTSGTTGTPKAASRGTGMKGGAALVGVLEAVPYRQDDVMYLPNPMFHALGVLTFAIGMLTGATLALPDRFDPRQALEDLERHQVTAAAFVPVMLRRMLDLEDPPDVDTSRLRIVLVSGAALPVELRRRAKDRLGDVVYDLYGSTEAGWIAVATPETMRAAPDAVGRPVAGVEIAILDEEGQPIEDGEGEVHVASPATFEGYDSGEETAQREGYLSTGDLGYVDDDGYLHVVGRADDMVVVGGENVYPDEVEAVIAELDGVAEVSVLGVEDPEMGEVLAAFVVGSVDEETVTEACEAQLPSYKVPRHVRKLDELPRTSTGKVLRRELAEQLG